MGYVIADGNPFDGVNLHGPFGAKEDAEAWANDQGGRLDGWNIIELEDGDSAVLVVSQRERDAIIAALRLWQHTMDGTTPDMIGLIEIAQNGRGEGGADEDAPQLQSDEIDTLIETRISI